MFMGCNSLTNLDLSSFDTSSVQNMSYMFYICSSLTNLDLSSFDTSNVTNMRCMFGYCKGLTNLDLSGFDTSNVTEMASMFSDCTSLTNLDLSSFDTSNVTDMSYMFSGCNSLTNLDLSSFNTSNVTSMGCMFYGCKSLTNLDLSSFDTSNVTNMNNMFGGCSSLTNLDLSSFDTSNVTYMAQMFYGCKSLTNLDLSSFDTSNVTHMSSMFYRCNSLTNLDLSSFNTSNVTNMSSMFFGWDKLTNLDLSSFDTSNVTDMSFMFYGCNSLTNLDYSSFNTSNVTSMDYMFYGCNSLTNLDLSSFNTSNLATMYEMFSGCGKLTNLDLSSFNTSNVPSMAYMFEGCASLTNLDLSGFDTSNVTYMGGMFEGCASLTNLDLSSFDTSKVTDMYGMFYGCNSLTNLDLSSFDTSNVTYMSSMFDGCNCLEVLKTPKINNVSIELPLAMYDKDGNTYTDLPILSESIVLASSQQQAVAASYPVLGIKFDKEDITIKKGNSSNLTATVFPDTAFNKAINWSSSDEAVATVDAEGNITTLKIGTADITATTVDGGFTAVCKVTVEAPNVSGITLDNETLTLKRGETGKLTATVEPTDAADKSVAWSSSDETVATVDAEGNITTLKIGTADITATTVDAGFTAVCKVTVEVPNVSGITLDKENASLVEGDTLQLTATIAPEDAGNKSVTWTSSDATVATVNENGLVTAVSEGSADITVTTDDGGFTAVCKVEIAKKISFKDVADENLWYYDSVYWAVRNNVTSGMGEGTFQPMAKLSRAQAVTFLYNLAGRPDVSGLPAKEFTDVSKTAWYYNAVKWAVANKITSGYGTGTFQPNATCNRAMIVTFLANYAKVAGTYKEPTTSASFKDVKATDWFRKSVDWAVENGITSGYGQGTFSPNVTCNRAMMVTFLKKVAELPKV